MRSFRFVSLVSILFISMIGSSFGQGNRINIFKHIKVGQWIDLSGTPQRSGPVLAGKVKLLTGDFLVDDCEIGGVVTGIDRDKKTIFLHGMKVETTKDTEYEGIASEVFSKFEHLKVDQVIELEGIYMKNGVFRAIEIENETNAPKVDEKRRQLAMVGQIEAIDPRAKTIKVMGLTFKVTPTTKMRQRLQ